MENHYEKHPHRSFRAYQSYTQSETWAMTVHDPINRAWTTSECRFVRQDVRTGTNTPYADRQAGKLRENTYLRDITEIDDGRIYIGKLSGGCKAPNSYVFNYNSINFDIVPEPLTADLLARVYNKWKGSTFSVGVTVGEGRESLKMIRDNLFAIARAAKSLKRGDFSGVFRALGKMPSSAKRGAQSASKSGALNQSWLELQFGWLPMIHDIYEATKQVNFVPLDNRYRSSLQNDGSITASGTKTDLSEFYGVENYSRKHLKVTVRNQPSFAESWGLTDPASVVWELIPYSFVVDWFLPIGSYLTSLHALQVMQGDAVMSKVRVMDAYCEIRLGRSIYPSNPSYSYKIVCGMPYGHKRYFTLNRDPMSLSTLGFDLAKELPRAIVPQWDWNTKQVVNGASLVLQRLGSFR